MATTRLQPLRAEEHPGVQWNAKFGLQGQDWKERSKVEGDAATQHADATHTDCLRFLVRLKEILTIGC